MRMKPGPRGGCAAQPSTFGDLDALTVQPVAPFAHLVRRKPQPPSVLAVVEPIDEVGPAGGGRELADQGCVAEGIFTRVRP